jgi:hypothetical protein
MIKEGLFVVLLSGAAALSLYRGGGGQGCCQGGAAEAGTGGGPQQARSGLHHAAHRTKGHSPQARHPEELRQGGTCQPADSCTFFKTTFNHPTIVCEQQVHPILGFQVLTRHSPDF